MRNHLTTLITVTLFFATTYHIISRFSQEEEDGRQKGGERVEFLNDTREHYYLSPICLNKFVSQTFIERLDEVLLEQSKGGQTTKREAINQK